MPRLQGHRSENLDIAVAMGDLGAGVEPFRKFGFNLDVDAALETVWDAGGLYAYPASALAMTAESSTANDDGAPAGTGARTIRVYGLDANYDRIDEEVTMNGVTPVALTNSYLRVFRVRVLDCGSLNTNDGNISIKNGGVTYGHIAANEGSSLMAIYTVPAGYTLLINYFEVSASIGGTGPLTARLLVRPFDADNAQAFQTRDKFVIGSDNDRPLPFTPPFAVSEKSDVEVRAIGGLNLDVSASFSGYLVKNAM